MRKILYALAAITVLFTINSLAQSGDIEFKRYDDSYFEKNNSGLEDEPSYLVLTDQAEFDKIFAAAARMKNNNFLPKDTFDSKIVIATIKRGSSLRTYAVEKVTAEEGKLTVWYTTQDKAPGSATFKSPLILTVDKGDYNEVVFMANGKKAGEVNLGN